MPGDMLGSGKWEDNSDKGWGKFELGPALRRGARQGERGGA